MITAGLFFYGTSIVSADGTASLAGATQITGGDHVTVSQSGNTITIAADGVTEAQLNEVKTKAETAQSTADEAKTKAEAAQSTADEANTKAATNKTDIAQNKTDIAGLKTQAAADEANITTNANNITALQGRVATNETNIAQNKTDIAGLKTQAAADEANITTNANNITALQGRVATDEGKITKNTNDITALKTDLSNAFDGDFKLHYFKANSDIKNNDDAVATGLDAIAIGSHAKTEGNRGVAMGQYAEVSKEAEGGIAIGSTNTKADGTLGADPRGAFARAKNGVAIGTDAEVTGSATSGVSIGEGAITGARIGMEPEAGVDTILVDGGARSVSVGHRANARGNSSIAIGDGAKVFHHPGDGVVSNSIALGTGANTNSSGATAIGNQARVAPNGADALAVGSRTEALKMAAIAVGKTAKADGVNGIAIGTEAKAGDGGVADNMVAIGRSAQAQGIGAIALGENAMAPGDDTITIGQGSSAAAYHSIVIGEASGVGMVDDEAHVNGAHIVIGLKAGGKTNGQEDIAIGAGAGINVSGNYNIAIGSQAGTNIGAATDDTNSKQLRTVSIGYHSNNYAKPTSISQATAVGSETKTANQATAIGASATAEGNGSTAIGFSAHALGEKTMAFGEEAKATGTGHIAIGGGALASDAMAAGRSYLTNETATQVVSVGDGNATSALGYRRIVNVADGFQPHDAVTVNQLKTLQGKTASLVGVSVAEDGTYGNLIYKGANYNSVQAVLNALDPTMGGPGGTPSNVVTYTNADHTEVSLTPTAGAPTGANVKITNLAKGTEATDAVNLGQMKEAVDGAKIHYYSVKTDDAGMTKNNYNNDGAKGEDSIALGIQAKATETRSVALGNNTSAQSVGSIVLGAGYKDSSGITDTVAEPNSSYSMAIGAGAQAAGTGSIAIGTRAFTKKKVNNVLDPDGSKESIALGYFASTSNQKGIAMGSHALTTGESSTAIGTKAEAQGNNTIAMGTEATTDSGSSGSGAIGYQAKVTNSANTFIIGKETSAHYASHSNVFGSGSVMNGTIPRQIKEATIVGNDSKITQGDATAITDILMSGNRNTITGSSKPDSAAQGKAITEISVTGHGNTIKAPNNDKPLTDIQVIGNNNKIAATAQPDPEHPGSPLDKFAPDYSHVQVLGSNVTVAVGNSVYLGTDNTSYLKHGAQTAGGAWYNDVIDSTVAPGDANLNLYTDPYERSFAALHAVGVVSVGDKEKERRIQNVAAGLVAKGSTDAINGSQLYALTLPLRFAGDNSTLGTTPAGDKNVLHRRSDEAMSILGGAPGTTLTEKNIGVVADAKKNTITIKLNKDVKLGQTGSIQVGKTSINKDAITTNVVKAGNTTVNTNGLTVGGLSFTTNNVNVNNQQIHNVKAGEAATDAVNVSQLQASIAGATTEVKAGNNIDVVTTTDTEDGHAVYTVNGKDTTVSTTDASLSVTPEDKGNGVTDYSIKLNDVVTVGSETGNPVKIDGTTGTVNGLTNKTWDPDNITSGQAATEDQLRIATNNLTEKGLNFQGDAGTAIHKKLGGTVDIVGGADTSKLTEKNVGVVSNEKGQLEVKLAQNIDLTKSGSVTMGDTLVNNEGLTITGGPTVTKTKVDMGGQQIHNVKAGEAATDAVNVSQLQASIAGATTEVKAGNNIDVVTTTDTEDGHAVYTVNGKDTTVSTTDASLSVTPEDKGNGVTDYSIKLNDVVTVGSGATTKVTIDGTTGTVNGLTNKSWDPDNFTSGQAATEDQLRDATTAITNNLTGKGLNFQGDAGTAIHKDLGETVDIVGRADTSKLTEKNIGVVSNEKGQLEVKLAQNIDLTKSGSVTMGDTLVNNEGLTIKNGPSVTNEGIHAGDQKITNVAPGTIASDSTDAVNGSQLYNTNQTIANIGNQISKLDGRVNKVGAGAAALAAMHPLDFDPDDKWNVSAGYGSYKGSHAGAIGAFYRPDENTMFNIGASVGGGENMVNAGVTFALDRKSHITTSRTAMAREIMDLRKEITELKAARANGNWMLDPEMTKLFPDVPENHWAYEYIAKLAGNGIIKGYPDGSFAGNRMMTRYEFAALLYRAMENGANVDARALKEFAPEMGRIRVDRVYGKDNDRNKIERVRVNNENTQERDTYGSKIQIAAK